VLTLLSQPHTTFAPSQDDYGGNSSGKDLSNVVTIDSNFYAFVATKQNGDMVAWGG